MPSETSVPTTSRRPYVVLSVAVSVDGYIDDTAPDRLLLSGAEDFDRVDAVRASCDALLIGASTLRRDNPRLVVSRQERRRARLERGQGEHPLKVVLSASGVLDPGLRFWHSGGGKVVYVPRGVADDVRRRLGGAAEVVEAGPQGVELGAVLDDLYARGVRRLMVEGGGTVHTQFLEGDLADELHVAVAPLLVGDGKAPRFLYPAVFPGGVHRRMQLLGSECVGDVVLLRYRPKGATA